MMAEQENESPVVDIVFTIDCTGSMGPYIAQVQQNVKSIIDQIKKTNGTDLRLAYIEYRDHPPQDHSYITQVHEFTTDSGVAKGWISKSRADGGGDSPEAVADGLFETLKLRWRYEALKICVFICDAPPHGIGVHGDGFKQGCPLKIDPLDIAHRLSERGVIVYCVGCEPSINPYKDLFIAFSYMTSGQYVPLLDAASLAKVIVGGAQEEISLQQVVEDISEQMETLQVADDNSVQEEQFCQNVHRSLVNKGYKTTQLLRNGKGLHTVTEKAKEISNCRSLEEMRKIYNPNNYENSSGYGRDSDHTSERFTVVQSVISYEQTFRMTHRVAQSYKLLHKFEDLHISENTE